MGRCVGRKISVCAEIWRENDELGSRIAMLGG